MSDLEITALVLSEHDVFRREFASLQGRDPDALGAAWRDLAARLEVHAVAEERLFYPLLARAGGQGAHETEDGVHDHNGIRSAVRDVEGHEVGSPPWWVAVRAAQEVNADHMAEEEREFFPDFTAAVPPERRAELGMQWLAFHDEHEDAEGLSGADADPQQVAAAEVPEGLPDGL